VARDKREERDSRDGWFEVPGSKFLKPRTSDLEPSSVPPVSLVSLEPGIGGYSRSAHE